MAPCLLIVAALLFLRQASAQAGEEGDTAGAVDLLEALRQSGVTNLGDGDGDGGGGGSSGGGGSDTGPQRLRATWYLRGESRELRVPIEVWRPLLLRNTSAPAEFTLAALLRQDPANVGTLLALTHSGGERFLEIQSSGRRGEVRLHYTSSVTGETAVRVESFPVRVADGAWHRLALSVSADQVELVVDCVLVARRVLRWGPPDVRAGSKPGAELWVGQRGPRRSFFRGALQDLRLVAGPRGALSQCPHLPSAACPTCAQHHALTAAVRELQRALHELTARLHAAETRVNALETCDCVKACPVNGTLQPDGATWQHGCQLCACVHGEVHCRPVQCPRLYCKNPVVRPGECCSTCLKQCYIRGVMYDHGEAVSLRECLQCECRDGNMHCVKLDPAVICPELKCPPQEQFSVPGECCKFCPDVDECTQAGGFEGHHCNANTRCVNTVGGYECECLPGFRRVDKFNCAEEDECAVAGRHECHAHASCVNTHGSYACHCLPGYSGDGRDCKPVCAQQCQNGGTCVAPASCACRRGYAGDSCERDVDECAAVNGVGALCGPNAVCVNMPGWWYCKCAPGFRGVAGSAQPECTDIDECADGVHTCPAHGTCVNTPGGYHCECAGGVPCDCAFGSGTLAHGEVASAPGQPCRRCECNSGLLNCAEPVCDCDKPHDRKCCPQCDPNQRCAHQELPHVLFSSSERWIYQCQTCECLYGEIDCWPIECPPVWCASPRLDAGDCCPRCGGDDPCGANVTSCVPPVYDHAPAAPSSPYCQVPFCEPLEDGRLCCSADADCGVALPGGVSTARSDNKSAIAVG